MDSGGAGGYDRELREVAKRDRAREAAFLQRQVKPVLAVPKLANRIAGTKAPPQTGAYFEKLDPARNKPLCEVPRSVKSDVDAAVAAAKQAQPAWGATPLRERCAVLRKTAELIERDMDRLVRMESEDTGKPVKLASSLDIPRAARNFRFFADFLEGRIEAKHAMEGHTNVTHRVPVGVVGLITPWNLPLYLLTWKVAPALGLGNAVVAKPSELTPRTADALADLLEEAGLPAGVYNVVHGLGPEAGEPLVAHPDVRAVSFTGGTATGSKVAAAAGAKKLSLELGGKNPSVVFADADFDAAVAGVARAAFTNQGQICLCGSRILVESSIHDRFVKALAAKAASMRIGDPLEPDTDLGSLVSAQHLTKVESYLEMARGEKAKFHTGGGRPDLPSTLAGGAYLEPTVLTGVKQESRLVQEEIFGPVVTVQPFSSEAEAVKLANGVRFGLAATVWTKDQSKARRIAEQLETGMVWVNCWLVRDLAVPFGGMKDSGFGREGGEWSVDFYSEARNICYKDGSA
ncbi:MAG: aminomuconate-semialdehyde/2-hydroxymuconate-6-semialdehyde dehydrogenase [Thermoplasmata archaeon]|jgi:aminomuconate-semialdehyde/2-hydroxymuconate-6-semialdehyde dehydrogenase|nr:aminomuconate-semialdehyde/2-hydroxymuconate-6-semialdehyde dehydrogenase [Thermoplasmata archaeon]